MKRLTILIPFVAALAANAQPDVEHFKLYDIGNVQESFNDVYAKADGGFYACGFSGGRAWLAMVDEEYNREWNLLEGAGILNSVIEADNGDVLAGGKVNDMFAATRVNEEGEVIWSREYIRGTCTAVIELKQGDFVLCGWHWDGNLTRGRLVCIDGDGEVIWEGDYGDGDAELAFYLTAMRETEGGIVAVGKVQGRDPNVGWILKVDFDGEQLWSILHQLGGVLSYNSIVSLPGGGFALGGYSKVRDNNAKILFTFAEVDSRGQVIETHVYDLRDDRDNICTSMAKLPGGGFLLVGERLSQQAAWRSYPLAIGLNSEGEFRWINNFRDQVERQPQGAQRNILTSAVTRGQKTIISGRFYSLEREHGADALLMVLATGHPGPELFIKIPEDSLQTVLPADSIQFIVRALNRQGIEAEKEWALGDSVLNGDTTVVIRFDSLGDYPVTCRISGEEWEVLLGWMVQVRDLFISAFTPDTLNLAIRRGTSVDFSLDTVRYTEGDEPEYLWTKSNLDDGQQEIAGRDARATVAFLQSGNYAVEGLIYRGESSDAVTWNVAVRGAIWSFAPEDLSLEVLPDSTVRFEVVPSEPENEALAIRWLVDGEVAGEDSTSFEWSFSGADLNPPYQVTVVVADTVEADTVSWEVVVRDLGIDNPTADPPRLAALLQVSPNPFNSLLTIRYSFAAINSGKQALAIYDLSGREVARLGRDEGWGMRDEKAADRKGSAEGTRALIWNASSVPAGVYLVRLQSGHEVLTKKVVLIQ